MGPQCSLFFTHSLEDFHVPALTTFVLSLVHLSATVLLHKKYFLMSFLILLLFSYLLRSVFDLFVPISSNCSMLIASAPLKNLEVANVFL